jgi:hypothetical protein
MYRIVRRGRILALARVHEIIIILLGIAGLAGFVLAGILSGFALSR